jgi:hypothetical protein
MFQATTAVLVRRMLAKSTCRNRFVTESSGRNGRAAEGRFFDCIQKDCQPEPLGRGRATSQAVSPQGPEREPRVIGRSVRKVIE